jgi:hypothetical protein
VTPGAKRFLLASTAAIGATGLAWAWMRYLWGAGPEPLDPELLMEWTGVHPWEPMTRTLHLLAAPFAVFALGLIWTSHVAPKLRGISRSRRRTGLLLTLLAAPMVLSGVLLQVATSEEARLFWVWVHGASSGLWLLGFVAHLLTRHPTAGATRA